MSPSDLGCAIGTVANCRAWWVGPPSCPKSGGSGSGKGPCLHCCGPAPCCNTCGMGKATDLNEHDVDCTEWKRRRPVWGERQQIPTEFDPVRPWAERNCSGYTYPPHMTTADCKCWEKVRIETTYGLGYYLVAGTCALSASQTAARVYNPSTCPTHYNALLHCMGTCCLYKELGTDKTNDIVTAHECCYIHTNAPSGPDDTRQDIRFNLVALFCANDKGEAGCDTCCTRRVKAILGTCGGGGASS